MKAFHWGFVPFRACTRMVSAFRAAAAVLVGVIVQDIGASSVSAADAPNVGQLLTRYRIVATSGQIIPANVNIGSECDDCETTVTFPFPVTVYGQTFTTARAGSNGTLQFGSSPDSFFNVCLPHWDFGYAIAAHWDDLRTDASGLGIFTGVFGSAPQRVFVIEWRAAFFFDPSLLVNFEVVFFENRPNFEIIYGHVTDSGASATVGVQKDSIEFTQYSCNEEVLVPGLRLLFGGAGALAVDDLASVPVNGNTIAVDVLANDLDYNGYGLRVASVTPAGNGFVGIAADGGSVTYSPVAEFVGSDSFTYTVSNIFGLTATATVQVAVVNHDPTARDDSATTAEDTAVTVAVLANDDFAPDLGETLSVISAGGASHGTLSYALTSVTYTPAANYHGSDSFTYTIRDNHGGTATARVNVTILPVNDNPTATDDAAVVDQGASVTVDALANDTAAPDAGESLSIVAVQQPAHGSAQFTAGSIVYTPAPGFSGVDSFSYTISDGNGGLASALVVVTVRNVNTAPHVVLASPASLHLNEGDPLTITGTIIDPDPADTHTVVVNWGDGSPVTTITLPNGLRHFSATHVFLDNPPAGSSFAPIVVTVSDSHGEQDVATLQVTVHNAPPKIELASVSPGILSVGSAVEASVEFSDPGIFDSHQARFVWGDGTPDTTIGSGGFSRAATHVFAAPGIYSANVVVSDKDGATASKLAGQVIVIDPRAGFVTGGGWLNVGAGVWASDLALSGKANFELEMQYGAGGALNGKVYLCLGQFQFSSVAFDWLVISGPSAYGQGRGTVNGSGEFIFRVYGADLANTDEYRLQVWNASTGEIVFDTAGLQQQSEARGTPIGGGNIRIHSPSIETKRKSAQASPSKLARSLQSRQNP